MAHAPPLPDRRDPTTARDRSTSPLGRRPDPTAGDSRLRSTVTRPVRVRLVGADTLTTVGLAAMLHRHRDRVDVDPQVPATPEHVDVVLVDMATSVDVAVEHVNRLVDLGVACVAGFGWHVDPRLGCRVLEAGACGVVWPGLGADDLCTLLETLHRGCRRTRRRVPAAPDWQTPATRQAALSEREAETLTLMCRGLSNAEIMYISPSALKNHIRWVHVKVGCTRRTQVMLWGRRHGIGSTPWDLD
ncbi:response regulator transcription factor [Nocardioides marinquilinus]|uniref:Response regulator transcription factor n=1 Tax=Nocardioides marinquilinus TaxID=1210400 RepID=A0ABP9P6P8_9ACTN